MHKVFGEKLSEESRKKLEKKPQPDWTDPMLATLTDDAFSDKGWIFERKLDGERCMAFRHGKNVKLMSRNKKPLNETYPEVVDALRKQKSTDFIIDGEIVAFENNLTSFSKLQNRMHLKDASEAENSGIPVFYYIFDIIYFEGHMCEALTVRERKSILRAAISSEKPLRLTPHRNKNGEAYLKEACGKGWEGLIAKDAGSRYVHSRSRKWLKLKCVHEQEFVICGFTDPRGQRIGLGALLIGYYDDEKLRYAGKVGTGFSDKMLKELRNKLEKKQRKTSPVESEEVPEKNVHWVKPELVAQIGFTQWTNDGKLRHPRFLGVRRDKNPANVVRERGG